MKPIPLIIIFLLSVLFINCEKEKNEIPVGTKLEFYLLDTYSTLGNSQEIITSSATLSENVLINYDDIISYSKSKYVFKIRSEILEQIKGNDGFNFHGKAFAVAIDKEIIYTGYFWTSFSSGICEWVTTDPIDYQYNNGLKISLGYPSDLYGSDHADKRNDKRILKLLLRDNKLTN